LVFNSHIYTQEMCFIESMHNKKLSYRRSSHLASLYRTAQKTFRYSESFKGVHINYRKC